MIPLRIHRLLVVLIAVSAVLALVDDLLLRIGVPRNLIPVVSGTFAGGLVFLLAYEGGRILSFCGKGLVDDQERRGKIRAALLSIGVIEERRRRQRRKSSKNDQRRVASRNPGALAMYVSVIDSPKFIAVSVNEGGSHRAFVSTGMVDQLSPDALRGVLAHEFGHIENAHPLKQASILGMVAAVKMSIGVPLGAIVAILMAYLFMLREWEYVADATAVKRTGAGDVLKAFSEYRAIANDKNMSLLSEMFSGHPSVHRRVAAVERQATA